jgi:hypothetical protein
MSVSSAERSTPVQACVATVLISAQHITLRRGSVESAVLLMLHCAVDVGAALLLAPGLDERHSFTTIVLQCASDVHRFLPDDAVETAKFLQNNAFSEDVRQ